MDAKIAEMGMEITEMDVKSVQDTRLIAKLKEFTKDKFWITDIYKHTTSGLSPGIMDEIIGNDEELYHFTRLHRGEF